jgi:hypothetical protein
MNVSAAAPMRSAASIGNERDLDIAARALKWLSQAALKQSHSQRLESIFDQASAERGVDGGHGNPIWIIVSIHGLRVAGTPAVG